MIIFDAIADKNKPATAQLGLAPMTLVTAGDIWHGGEDQTKLPSAGNLAKLAASEGVLCLDIENRKVDSLWDKSTPAATRETNRAFLGELADAIHEINPAKVLGYFSLMPAPSWSPDSSAWTKKQEAIATGKFKLGRDAQTGRVVDEGLADKVNVIFPQCYLDSSWTADFATRLIDQLVEAGRTYQKQVYPFLRPYCEDNQIQPVAIDIWKAVLEHTLAVADGCVIWTPWQLHPWNDQSPWWLEVKKVVDEGGGA